MILSGILLIILSLLAVPGMLKNEKGKELIRKIAPFQGWIGLVFMIWGIWDVFNVIRAIEVISDWPISWAIWLATGLLELFLGFLLAYNLIVQYVLSKNESSKEKGEALMAKLSPLQAKLGLAGIIVGILSIVFYFINL